jgi:hypothetical protein
VTVYTNAASLLGVHVAAAGGESLGRIDHVYTDEQTGKPEWVAVHTGLFDTHISLVPASAFSWTPVGETLTVSLSRQVIGRAPHHDAGALVTPSDEQDLNSYYRILPHAGTQTAGRLDFDHRRLRRFGTERADIPR